MRALLLSTGGTIGRNSYAQLLQNNVTHNITEESVRSPVSLGEVVTQSHHLETQPKTMRVLILEVKRPQSDQQV